MLLRAAEHGEMKARITPRAVCVCVWGGVSVCVCTYILTRKRKTIEYDWTMYCPSTYIV